MIHHFADLKVLTVRDVTIAEYPYGGFVFLFADLVRLSGIPEYVLLWRLATGWPVGLAATEPAEDEDDRSAPLAGRTVVERPYA